MYAVNPRYFLQTRVRSNLWNEVIVAASRRRSATHCGWPSRPNDNFERWHKQVRQRTPNLFPRSAGYAERFRLRKDLLDLRKSNEKCHWCNCQWWRFVVGHNFQSPNFANDFSAANENGSKTLEVIPGLLSPQRILISERVSVPIGRKVSCFGIAYFSLLLAARWFLHLEPSPINPDFVKHGWAPARAELLAERSKSSAWNPSSTRSASMNADDYAISIPDAKGSRWDSVGWNNPIAGCS